MINEIEIQCPVCRNITIMPDTSGSHKELINQISTLENKLFKLAEENKDLRQIIMKIGR